MKNSEVEVLWAKIGGRGSCNRLDEALLSNFSGSSNHSKPPQVGIKTKPRPKGEGLGPDPNHQSSSGLIDGPFLSAKFVVSSPWHQEIPHEGAFGDIVWSDPEDIESWAVQASSFQPPKK